MSARLRRDGHEVREASDGYEAWQAIELESFLADGAQDTAVRDS